MDFIIDQLVGLFDAHFRSGIHFTADQIACRFGFIDSYAGDLPAMLRTPRRLDSSCKSRQLSWGLPWRLDFATSRRCAFKLLHVVRIMVLILGSTSGVLIST